MKYYYYKIENKVNQKKYIGITTDIETRERTHFAKLRKNKHINSKLQYAWNKYGEKNFFFEKLEELNTETPEIAYQKEADLIEKFDSYENGYNGNLGGLCHNGPRGFFDKDTVFKILIAHEKYPICGTILSEIYNCNRKTINNIYSGINYHAYYEEYLILTPEEKDFYFENFCEETDFIKKFSLREKKGKGRKLSSEQVYMFLYQKEFNYPQTRLQLMEDFNMRNYSTIAQIFNGKSYKKEVYEYGLMDEIQKEQIKCHYMETYKRKSPELLETLKNETISNQA